MKKSDFFDFALNTTTPIAGPRGYVLDSQKVLAAVNNTRGTLKKIAEFEINLVAILGMRNLSALVGEVFAASMRKEFNGILEKNPHQDGYPDLLLLDHAGKAEWSRLQNRLREKHPFSPFVPGGFEVKATCGSVPSAQVCVSRGIHKPDIGDRRIALLQGYDWKAHHRETNHLFGIVWDFIGKIPCIVAVFYSNRLTLNDWGHIVKPKQDGGRTTSVSIMTKDGIKKMYEGWVLVANSLDYAKFFDKKNKATLLANALSAKT